MAKDTVLKAEVLCHFARKKEVLTILENTGKVHLIDMSTIDEAPLFRVDDPEKTSLHPLSVALEKVIPLLQERSSSKKKLPTQVLTVDELSSFLAEDAKLVESSFQIVTLFDKLATLKANSEDIQRRMEFVKHWIDLPFRFDQIGSSETLCIKAGQVSAREGFSAIEKIAADIDLMDVIELSNDKAVIVWHLCVEDSVSEGLTEAGFVASDFGGYSGTPEEELQKLTESYNQTTAGIEIASNDIDSFVTKLPELKALFDAVSLQMLRDDTVYSGRISSSALLLHLWIRENDLSALEEKLDKLGEVDVAVIEPSENENVPVFLSESASADPYLMLTDMYGRPEGADPDPTPLMAPFYVIFFGICIGDAGYGLALAIGSAIGWYLTNKREGNTRLFRLMFQGGLASILWGFLLGGWFGMPFDSLPGILQDAAMPLNNLVPNYTRGVSNGFALSQQFLYLTLGFGLVQLAWGIIVSLKKRLANGEGLSAIIDQTGWMLALLGLFPWLFNHYLLDGAIYPIGTVWDTVFLTMLAAGALLIFIMGGKEAEGIGGKVGLGAYACYGIVNLLGDVLSYSRLFALALSSAIIASVINEIAGMLTGIPVIGIVLTVLVLVAGHLFNLGMAVLSGFIHTARLQFVEFFGKFYDGTGVPFKALRYEPKFVRIKR